VQKTYFPNTDSGEVERGKLGPARMKDVLMGHSSEEVVSIIPARSGSVRFPHKNIAYLGSKRLLEWVICAALGSAAISKVYVSTDSEAYAAIARDAGATPIMRPVELATETSRSEDVIVHALDCLRTSGHDPAIAVLQQATTPLTKPGTIRKAILAVRSGFDTALSVFLARKKPWWAFRMDGNGSLTPFMSLPKASARSASNAPLYYPTGGVYAFKTEFFRRTNLLYGGSTYGVLVEWYEAIDIDYRHDLEFADFAMKRLKL
jgi:CMP-N,N'-diacetyllegionaminic acid synthase